MTLPSWLASIMLKISSVIYWSNWPSLLYSIINLELSLIKWTYLPVEEILEFIETDHAVTVDVDLFKLLLKPCLGCVELPLLLDLPLGCVYVAESVFEDAIGITISSDTLSVTTRPNRCPWHGTSECAWLPSGLWPRWGSRWNQEIQVHIWQSKYS